VNFFWCLDTSFLLYAGGMIDFSINQLLTCWGIYAVFFTQITLACFAALKATD
jgi:hypothetical protein